MGNVGVAFPDKKEVPALKGASYYPLGATPKGGKAMEVETMLKVYAECGMAQKTAKRAECNKCPLAKEVKLSMAAQTPDTGVLSEITISVSPCLLITEIAKKL